MLRGSICLSDIPKELIKKVKCKDGKERCFLNFAIFKRKEPATFGDITYTSPRPAGKSEAGEVDKGTEGV